MEKARQCKTGAACDQLICCLIDKSESVLRIVKIASCDEDEHAKHPFGDQIIVSDDSAIPDEKFHCSPQSSISDWSRTLKGSHVSRGFPIAKADG